MKKYLLFTISLLSIPFITFASIFPQSWALNTVSSTTYPYPTAGNYPSVNAPFFTATSTTATSTFAGGLTVNGNGTSTLVTGNEQINGSLSVGGNLYVTASILTSLGAGAVSSSATGLLSSGTLPVNYGGTGAATLTGCLTGNGTGAITGSGSACSSGSGSGNVATSTLETSGNIPVWSSTSATPATLASYANFTFTNGNNQLSIPNNGWYSIGGNLLGYASSTNQDTIFGIRAGGNSATTSSNNLSNTAIGYKALYSNTTGINNTAIGNNSMDGNAGNTTGTYNTAIGASTLKNITNGSQNTAIGYSAGSSENSSLNNTIVGYFATPNGSGSGNTVLGANTGPSSSGTNNVIIGNNTASTTSTGSKNIIIGYDIATPSITSSNTLNIGNLIFGTGINGEGTSISTGSIGIATTSPLTALDVNGNITDESVKNAGCLGTDNNGTINTASCTATSTNYWYANGTSIYNANSGNVGIGTTTPQYLLSVGNGTGGSAPVTDDAAFYNGAVVGQIRMGSNDANYWRLGRDNVSSGRFAVINNNGGGGESEKLSILVNGNVGIGTTTPLSKLAVGGTGGASIGNDYNIAAPTNGLIVEGNVGIGTTNPGAKLTTQADTGGNIFSGEENAGLRLDSNSSDTTLLQGSDSTYHIGYIQAMQPSVSWSTRNLSLQPVGGNVGIGTTTPNTPLDVNGDVTLGSAGAGVTMPDFGRLNVGITGDTYAALTIGDAANTTSAPGIYLRANAGNPAGISTGGSPIAFYVSGPGTNERMRITGAGVNIASASNPIDILQVNGAYSNDGKSGIMLSASDTSNPNKYSLRINPFVVGASAVGYQFVTTSSAGGTSTPMTFDNTGKVGIDNIAPTSILSVGNFLNTAANTPLFTIASTTAGTATSTFMTVLANGNVGIGTTSPFRTLSVTGTMAVNGLTAFAVGDSAVCQRAGGELTVDSGVSSCIVSSRKVKHDIVNDTIINALARINALNPVTFTYNGSNQKDIGLVADSVAKVDPRYAQYAGADEKLPDGQVIKKGDPAAINWNAINADLIVVVQNQQKEIDVLKSQVKLLTNKK